MIHARKNIFLNYSCITLISFLSVVIPSLGIRRASWGQFLFKNKPEKKNDILYYPWICKFALFTLLLKTCYTYDWTREDWQNNNNNTCVNVHTGRRYNFK